MAYIVFTRQLSIDSRSNKVMAAVEGNYNENGIRLTHDEIVEFLVKCVEVLAKEIKLQSSVG